MSYSNFIQNLEPNSNTSQQLPQSNEQVDSLRESTKQSVIAEYRQDPNSDQIETINLWSRGMRRVLPPRLSRRGRY